MTGGAQQICATISASPASRPHLRPDIEIRIGARWGVRRHATAKERQLLRLQRRLVLWVQRLLGGFIFVTLSGVTVPVNLPDELVARIDDVAEDRTAYVVEAVRNRLRELETTPDAAELARINDVADDLNREAEDVLEYQVIA